MLKSTAWESKIRCLDTTPESITSYIILPTHKIYFLSVNNQNNEATDSFIKMKQGLIRVHKRCCLVLDIACSHILIFLLQNLCVPIGRQVAP